MMNASTPTNLANVALQAYGLEHAHLTRLGGASNTNFRVDVDDLSYVLHLHTAARHDRAARTSELAWLRSLHTDTSLVLPAPIANRHGEFVTSVAADTEPETLCTLMTWVDGRIPPTSDTLTDAHLAQVGALMAHLHRHAQQFTLPSGFTRPTYDAAYFRARLTVLHTALSTTDVEPHALHHVKTAADQILAQFADMERTRDTFGVIHADFHSGNYVLHHDNVRIIDFDRCGFGFFMHDLALALMELREHQRPSLLHGYATVTPLPTAYARHLPMFLSLAYLDNLGFLAENPEELPFIEEGLPFVLQAFRSDVG